MKTLELINYLIALVFFICYSYQFVYIAIPYIIKEKSHKEESAHKFAVLISARNEENVIANLIDSIKNQTYDSELITIFVAADNCTDRTAERARKAGAVVYERNDLSNIGKGFALKFLLEHIDADYPDKPFDGYFVFDADNVLDENYISEMNKTFSDGYSIITSYRNSKNYGDNWISAGYSLWFLRESKYLNNARMLLKTSCAVSGTGFLFSREIIGSCGGWNFFLLTEDIEFTIYNVLKGEKVGYCHSAVLYDEQPTKFSQSVRQRMRWAKGYLQVFKRYGIKLICGVAKGSFSCFDMSMAIMPAIVLTVLGIIVNTVASILGAVSGENLIIAFTSILEMLKNAYLTMFVIGAITTISEWRQINTENIKKIWYMFTFPIFMLTYIPISFIAIFKNVQWTPIEHTRNKTLADIRRRNFVKN